MPQDCPNKDKIKKQAEDAKVHVENVRNDPALAPNLKNQLDLALVNIESIKMDNHK